MYLLNHELRFPPPHHATPEGLVAVGGDVRPERLILAYSQGIFPWPAQDMPLLWFSPDPRFVLRLDELRLNRSLRRALRRTTLSVRSDTRFGDVIDRCASARRPGQLGTWITPELCEGYRELHRLGFAHSVEAFDGETLVGGLYGVSLGRTFFGESMFSEADDASKVAFVALCAQLRRWDFQWIDCQVRTELFEQLGARDIPRVQFLTDLRVALSHPTRRGTWQIEVTPDEALGK